MHQKLQILRQKDLEVGAYTEEFHKLTLRAQVLENEKQKLARNLNGLKYSIKDELVLFNPKTFHQFYQMALKIEEKFKRKNDSHGRGKGGNSKGGGRFGGRGSSNRSQGKPNNSEEKLDGEANPRWGFRGRRPNGRGRSGGRTLEVFTGRCFTCN